MHKPKLLRSHHTRHRYFQRKGKGKQTTNPKKLGNMLIRSMFMAVHFNRLNSQFHHRMTTLLPSSNSFTVMSSHIIAAVENFSIKFTLTHLEI